MTADSIDSRFSETGKVTRMIYYYDGASYGNLNEILRMGSNSEKRLGMRDFTQFMLDASYGASAAIFWESTSGATYATSNGRLLGLNAAYAWENEAWVQEALASPRELIISAPHMQRCYSAGAAEVITFCRAYLNPDKLPMTDEVLGVMMLDVPVSVLRSSLFDYEWTSLGTLRLLNADGSVLLSDNAEGDFALPSQALDEAQQSGLVDEGSSCVIWRRIPSTGWIVAFRLNPSGLTGSIDGLRRYTLIMICLATMISLVLAVSFSGRMSKPIRRLKEAMQRVQHGDLTARVAHISTDELGEVSTGFNQMADDLQRHINTTYLARIGQTEAELNDLKAQIHPHFLYNTLEIIRMTAVQHEDRDSAEMVEALARQLKYVIGEVRERVPLSKELEMTRNYIALVEKRYGDIRMEEQLEPGIQGCEVLKLCLQPVVENAVQHGLRPRGGGCVRVKAARSGSDLLLTVMDDGVGMTEEQLNALNERLRSGSRFSGRTEDGWRGIGLKNVHDRITLTWGEGYGLTVQSL